MKYRKRPIVIDAFRWTDDREQTEPEWFATAMKKDDVWVGRHLQDGKSVRCLRIKTLEGTMTASIGDYIIRGVDGELYACRPDIFKKTYERVK